MTDKEILNYVKREEKKMHETWKAQVDGETRNYCMGYCNALIKIIRYIEGLEG